MATTEPTRRMASIPRDAQSGPVTLINSFVVPEGRDDAFLELWSETSEYFKAQPGFVSLRLHRAISPDAQFRYVNVAQWASLADFRAPHEAEFRRLVSQDGWREFPSFPPCTRSSSPQTRSGNRTLGNGRGRRPEVL